VHVIGIDEVSRRKGQVYLTVVYDLERRVLLWVGDDRTEEAVRPFFTEEMGKRRCRTLRAVCMDMWAPYAKLVRDHAVNAQILFDRFHIVKHLSEAVDAARRELWRQLTSKERVEVKGTRCVLLKNPWNLTNDQKERLSKTTWFWQRICVIKPVAFETGTLRLRRPHSASSFLLQWSMLASVTIIPVFFMA
jgi:transposase